MPDGPQHDSHPTPAPDNVLIVEDNAAIAAGMAKVLERGGYSPTVWHTGAQALNWVQSLNGSRGSLRAAILDLHLPDLHGLVLSSQLRGLLGPGVPIIIVSGDTSMENLNALPHVGATY